MLYRPRNGWVPVLAAALAIGSLMPSHSAFAADCASCDGKAASIKADEESIEKDRELLGKNRAYLTDLDPNSVSRIMKIESNILIILKRVDRSKKDVEGIKAEMQKEDCGKCEKKTQ